MVNTNYYVCDKRKIQYELNQMIQCSLPEFTSDYFDHLISTKTPKTCREYMYIIRLFFEFLMYGNLEFHIATTNDFQITHLSHINSDHIKNFLEYIRNDSTPCNSDPFVTLSNRSKSTRLACLRSFFNYFFYNGALKSNPAYEFDMPKTEPAVATYLNDYEIIQLLTGIDNYTKSENISTLSSHYPIVLLLLYQGLTVSECCDLNIQDIDFFNNKMTIRRKNKIKILEINSHVLIELNEYLNLDSRNS